MNFLGIGGFEILVIAAVAFLVLGPRKMSEAGKAFGKTLAELRRQRDELTEMVMQDPEGEYDDSPESYRFNRNKSADNNDDENPSSPVRKTTKKRSD